MYYISAIMLDILEINSFSKIFGKKLYGTLTEEHSVMEWLSKGDAFRNIFEEDMDSALFITKKIENSLKQICDSSVSVSAYKYIINSDWFKEYYNDRLTKKAIIEEGNNGVKVSNPLLCINNKRIPGSIVSNINGLIVYEDAAKTIIKILNKLSEGEQDND